jgi:hypothetical protein
MRGRGCPERWGCSRSKKKNPQGGQEAQEEQIKINEFMNIYF